MRRALVPILVATWLAGSSASAGPKEDTEECLGCHSDKDLSTQVPGGTTRPLFVDPDLFAKSVHGKRLACKDCHTDIRDTPHDAKPYKNLRDASVGYYEVCKRCHFKNYTKTLDSIHEQFLEKGDARAPLCVDCHGAHDTVSPAKPRSRISKTCSRCHDKVFKAYAESVHGKALLENENQDVPVCTDCHRSHDIANPTTAKFLLGAPALCGRCHTDNKMMSRYKLSTDVVQTYLVDFHGLTSGFQKNQAGSARLAATCMDCHGIHDIGRVHDDTGHMKLNLAKTCQRCHPDASDSFPAAWMSHYRPSWEKAPLVYGVALFYKIFIPFIIGGLILQIILHLWRVVVNR